MNFRNVLLFGAILTASSCFPDHLAGLTNFLARLQGRIKRYRESLRVRFSEKRASGFWEIDMTKFEP